MSKTLIAFALTLGLSAVAAQAQTTVSELINQIREISLSLSPPMLEDFGLLPTLQWHFERYQNQTGIKIAFHHNMPTQRLPADIEIAVYRIIQESLTNVARYARVTEATVQLTFWEDIIRVEVIDRGIGFTSNYDELKWSTAGLAGMRERANMLGGSLVIESIPGTGTRIQAMLPFNRKPMERRENDRNIFAG